jgi:hypothetical protein
MTTRREHTTATVVGGSTILQGTPMNPIDARYSGKPKRTQTEVNAHPSACHYLRGCPVSGVAPAVDINAHPTTPRPTRAPAVSWGMKGAHSVSLGNSVLTEGDAAPHTNNLHGHGQPHHSIVTKKG